jgi:hypothetical protein
MTVVTARGRGVAIISVPVRRDDHDRQYHDRNFIALRFHLFAVLRRGAPRKHDRHQGKRQKALCTHSCGLYLCVDATVDPPGGIGMSFETAGFKALCFPFAFRLWCRASCAGLSWGGRMDFLAALRSRSTALSQVLNRITGIFPGPHGSVKICERQPFSNESHVSSRPARLLESWINRFESSHRVLLNFFWRGSKMSSRDKWVRCEIVARSRRLSSL